MLFRKEQEEKYTSMLLTGKLDHVVIQKGDPWNVYGLQKNALLTF